MFRLYSLQPCKDGKRRVKVLKDTHNMPWEYSTMSEAYKISRRLMSMYEVDIWVKEVGRSYSVFDNMEGLYE